MKLAMHWSIVLWIAVTGQMLCAGSLNAAGRPNFLWIVSEDNSKHYLKLFDEHGAPTPHIEALAREGVVFEHAFSCSPVCSVARTTLITGCYAPRLGAQYHRRSKRVPLPPGLRMFPAYLRQAGYYTTNNSKKDYNAVEGKGVWDESSKRATWRNRPSADVPFFHMQTFGASHESSLHFKRAQMRADQLRTSPTEVALAPYHPDTPTFRVTYARYHDRMGVIDEAVGRLVARLERDGLLEDTFIFYFSDHGGVLPRSKGYIYEAGLHVPLVVRVPNNWKHLVTLERGARARSFVSFIDFGPTLLHLAGLDVPEGMDGRPFLGPDISEKRLNARDEAFGYADRFDEKYDLCRSLRKGRYKYIRHYQAFYPDALQNNYRYIMLAYQEWRALYHQGKLNAVQRQFFEPKPVEALYDLEADPHEVNNLAGDPAYAKILKRLRGRLRQWVKGQPDLSFYPESYLVEAAFDHPVAFGRAHAERIARLVDVADLSLLPFEQAQPELEAALASSHPWDRYWALIACSCFGKEATALVPAARRRLDDAQPLVRVRAAEFLGIVGAADPRPTLYDVLSTTRSPLEALLTLNTAVFFHDRTPGGYPFDLGAIDLQVTGGQVARRISYLERP